MKIPLIRTLVLTLSLLGSALAGTRLAAQEIETPYWVSLDADEAYMRVGPSENYLIDWVYKREGLPLKVLRVNEGWRLVEGMDGTTGWMHRQLLTRRRGAEVIGEGLAPMRVSGSANAALRWNLEQGVVGQLGKCEANWCELNVKGHRGWVEQSRLWGTGAP